MRALKRIRDIALLLAQITYHSFVPQAALVLSTLPGTGHWVRHYVLFVMTRYTQA